MNKTIGKYWKTPRLTGTHIYLDILTEEYLKDMYEYSSLSEFYTYMELEPHQSLMDTRDYLHKLFARVRSGNAIYWAICLKNSNKMIGTFGLVNIHKKEKRAHIGYGLSPKFGNRGFFKEALQLVLEFSFNDLGLRVIEAITMADNKPSVKGLKRLGFIPQKRIRKYYQKSTGQKMDAIAFEKSRPLQTQIPPATILQHGE